MVVRKRNGRVRKSSVSLGGPRLDLGHVQSKSLPVNNQEPGEWQKLQQEGASRGRGHYCIVVWMAKFRELPVHALSPSASSIYAWPSSPDNSLLTSLTNCPRLTYCRRERVDNSYKLLVQCTEPATDVAQRRHSRYTSRRSFVSR